ncbi:MAG: membrane dipeptidase [Pseudomonadota bacterium]
MVENDADRLHRDSIIIDGLNASYFLEQKVLERLKNGGITAVNATIAAWHTLPETISLIADYHYLLDQHADLIMPVHRVEDIQTAKKTQRVGFIFGFQDTSPIQDNERLLSVYHALSVKIIQLTYNHQNLVGGGCMLPEDKGLTAFGLKVIAEMNRLGILIDLSHCGPRTSLEAIEVSHDYKRVIGPWL